MLGIGDRFPEFKLNAVSGNMLQKDPDWIDADHEFITVDNWSLRDWSVIYFYPKDFTFICPTEITGMDILMQETEEVIGISGDNEFCKWAWKCETDSPLYGVMHPLAADCGLKLARECGVVNEEEGVCYRATFILDPQGYIAHVSVNRDDTGRNAKEILRTLQALKSGGLTGCEWNPGEEFVV